MSQSAKSKCSRFLTLSSSPLSPKSITAPVERADATAATSSSGNWRSARMFRISRPTLPVAPPPTPTNVSAGQFDTSRALARLGRILGDQRAHPVDSPADDTVRDRLITELRAIGLQPRIQEIEDCSGFPKSRVVSCSRVRNVIATVAGRAPGPHLLLSAHYDSTPTGPGAGDDGIGVATLIEVGSLLKATPP